MGTPDGALREGKPWTYYASMVHDALCQYDTQVPLKKDEVVRIFNDMLEEVGFPLRRQYVAVVNKNGP